MDNNIEIDKLLTEEEFNALYRLIPQNIEGIKQWARLRIPVYEGAKEFLKPIENMDVDQKQFFLTNARLLRINKADAEQLKESIRNDGSNLDRIADSVPDSEKLPFSEFVEKAEAYVELFENVRKMLPVLKKLHLKMTAIKEIQDAEKRKSN